MEQPIIRVAIADDHILVRRGIVKLIESMNFGCEFMFEAGDGIELLDKIDKAAIQPDVCLIDINMPKMDGYETIIQLQQRYPFIRCIALSVYNDELPVLRMIKNGARGYITKTDAPETIKKAILSVYSNDVFFSNEILTKCPRLLRIPFVELVEQILTEKEMKLLNLCCSELTYEQVALKLNMGKRTIENEVLNLSHKLNVKGRSGLILYALRPGITPRKN